MSRKTSRSLLSILLVFCMMFSMLPVVSLAAENEERDYVATVYVDGTNGANTAANDGSTEAKAKKGMTYAYQALYKAMGEEKDNPEAVGRIIVLNDVSFSSSAGPTPNSSDSVYAETHACTVVVTSKTGAESLVMKNNYINLGPTVYENITLTKADGAGTYTFFCANGYPLVIGEGVTCEPNASGSYMSLMGGVMPTTKSGGKLPATSLTGSTGDEGKSFTGNTDLTVMSGTWRNVYVGPYKGTMVGDAKLTMTGGTVTYKAGAAFSGKVDGNAILTITGGEIQGNLYGGGTSSSGVVTGSSTITLENAAVVMTDSLNGDLDAGTGVAGDVVLNIKDSVVEGTISGADTLNLTASEGKELTIGGGKLEADSFTGGGTLVLGDSASLKVDAVTGETAWQISGTPYNTDYITAPETAADEAFAYVPSGEESVVITTADGVKCWSITGGKDVAALKLTVPEDVSLVLHSGFATSGATIAPDQVVTDQGISTHVFINLPAGMYHYTASGEGYYNIKKNIYYSEDEAAEGQTVDCNPGQMAGDGFEQTSQIGLHTDEVMDTILNSDPDQTAWEGYEHVFTTPVFADGRAQYQQTTHDEMMDFLAGLDDDEDNMYSFVAGYTPVYNYEMPVAVFTATDLSGAETLEEAAELVKANGKPIIHYQGMIHPNEPAGGEGALAMIKALDGAYGDEILETVNVYVVPRINGDGAYVYQRANVAQSIDMNRDHMYVQSKEVEILHSVYNLFLPHVTIDGHEFSSGTTSTESTMDDVQVGTAGNLNSGEEFTEYSQAIVQETFKAARELGLRPYNYGTYASTVNNAIGRPYYALYGSLSFLIETRGIGSGLGWMERRVISQYIVAETIINYVVDNAQAILDTSNAERQRLVEVGGIYGEVDENGDDADILVLKHGVTKESYYEIDRPKWNLATGEKVSDGADTKVYYYDQIVNSRTRPTAYVISKGEPWAKTVTGIMDKNGIEYYQVEEGSAIMLQQYQGGKTGAVALDEQVVIFEDGAYVFPMDQIGANVLAMTMEPDVIDSDGYNGTLLQSGVVAPDSEGMIPIYRHIHNLDEDGQVELVVLPEAPQGLSVIQPDSADATGTITGLDAEKSYEYRAEKDAEYTVVPAGSTQITGLDIGAYYVRYAATETALASYDCKLDVINKYLGYTVYVDGVNGSDENVGWKQTAAVVSMKKAYEQLAVLMQYAPENTEGQIVFLDTVTLAADTDLPAHDYTVVLSSQTGAEGISSKFSFSFGGPTRLEDMTITLTVSDLRYIAANGHKMVIGENVTCVPSGSYYFNLAGGGNKKNVTNGTDLTVQSGTFRNIYAAGYTGTVTGDVKFTMTGGSTTAVLQSSYSGLTTGNVEMNISNAAIGGIIYGGNTKSGSVIGDVTITLGQGAAFAGMYAGSRDAGDVTGTVTVVVDGAEVSTKIDGGCANEMGSVGESVVILNSGALSSTITNADKVVLDTSDETTFQFSDDLTVDQVVGGGTVTWPADKNLTVSTGSVTGSTNVVLTGTPAEDDYVIAAPNSVSEDAFVYVSDELVFVTEETDGLRCWYLTQPEEEIQLVETIVVTPAALELTVGQSEVLNAQVAPDTAQDRTVTWSSSNPDVARVDEDGTVTAVAAGSAKITATANDGSGVSASCQVTVAEEEVVIPVPAKPYKITNTVSGVHVYWKAVEGAEKYGLWRSETGKNGTYIWIANPADVHFTDTATKASKAVESGKTYYYKVTAMVDGEHSEKSEAIGITYVGTPDITARYNKAAGVNVEWEKITGATGYAIYRKSYSGSDAWARVATIEGNRTFLWQDTSVANANGTAYKYTIRALAGDDMKTLSGCRNAGRTVVRLTSRTLTSAVKSGATSITCKWGTTAQATGYEVRFLVDGQVYKTFTIGNYKTGAKMFTGLEAGQEYKIQVRSYKKLDGMGFYSAWSDAKTVKL